MALKKTQWNQEMALQIISGIKIHQTFSTQAIGLNATGD